VHRREEAVEVVLEVARRDPDVVDRAARRERVDGRVEPPRVVGVPEPAHDLELELVLGLEREAAPRGRRLVAVAARDLLHERRLVLLHVLEQLPHLGRLHVALEVVEQDVVGLVEVVDEELDVALAEVEVPP
jgi:hypothetical protein